MIWQCGKIYYERYKAFENKFVKIFPFLEQIDRFYNECDIVISRAGALTISELCIVGKPSILVPSPNVSENHQFYNAKYLVDRKAAIMIEEKKINIEFLMHLQKILESKEIRRQLSKAIYKLARPNATKEIVLQINNILSTPPRPFHKVFNNVSDTHPLENCTGQNCNDCRLCYSFEKEKIIVENTKNYVKRDTSIN